MKTKIEGGVLLWNGVYEDFLFSFIDMMEVKRRLFLISRYEAGELSLKNLNKKWR